MTTQAHEDSIQEILDVIIESARPEQVILFGSRARGTFTEESDFDFLVIVRDVENEREVSRRVYRSLIDKNFHQAIDIVVVAKDKLEQHKENPFLIYAQALQEGKLFYERATAF